MEVYSRLLPLVMRGCQRSSNHCRLTWHDLFPILWAGERICLCLTQAHNSAQERLCAEALAIRRKRLAPSSCIKAVLLH